MMETNDLELLRGYRELQHENAQLKAELAKLREWQQIILGTGTDQEAVIRMAATKYTETAVACWRQEVEKLKAELEQLKTDRDEWKRQHDNLMAYMTYYRKICAQAKQLKEGA